MPMLSDLVFWLFLTTYVVFSRCSTGPTRVFVPTQGTPENMMRETLKTPEIVCDISCIRGSGDLKDEFCPNSMSKLGRGAALCPKNKNARRCKENMMKIMRNHELVNSMYTRTRISSFQCILCVVRDLGYGEIWMGPTKPFEGINGKWSDFLYFFLRLVFFDFLLWAKDLAFSHLKNRFCVKVPS